MAGDLERQVSMRSFSYKAVLFGAAVCVVLSLAAVSAERDAFEQNERLGRGVNIIGYDRIWWSMERGRFKEKHLALIREAGFDSVRVNLHPFRHMDRDNDYKLRASWFETCDWVVSKALANDLMVILDMHEFNAIGRDPEGRKPALMSFWRQVAEHFKDAPDNVIFEILNEPSQKLTAEMWNVWLNEALAIIRKTNPTRTVVIGPASWSSVDHLKKLELPEADRNIIVTVHYYKPMAFTHQGASWAGRKDKLGVAWGTEEEKQAVVKDFEKVQAWAKKENRPIFLGEFGAYDKAEMKYRTAYISHLTRQAEKHNWSWAYWQFDSNFILYDIGNDKWIEPIREALVPREKD